jgi:hypothetical protein
VAGVVPALETNHGIGVAAQQVNDFSFSLVPPLGAENYNALIHPRSFQKL